MKFRVTHNPKADKAKRYRYALVASNGQTLQSGEGYPTHQHVTRAIEGLWKGLAKVFGVWYGVGDQNAARKGVGLGPVESPPAPYTKDSLKPDERAPAVKKAAKKVAFTAKAKKGEDLRNPTTLAARAEPADTGYDDR